MIIKKLMQFFAYSKLWFIAGFNLHKEQQAIIKIIINRQNWKVL